MKEFDRSQFMNLPEWGIIKRYPSGSEFEPVGDETLVDILMGQYNRFHPMKGKEMTTGIKKARTQDIIEEARKK